MRALVVQAVLVLAARSTQVEVVAVLVELATHLVAVAVDHPSAAVAHLVQLVHLQTVRFLAAVAQVLAATRLMQGLSAHLV